jgi:hypothetical protein
VTVKRREEGAMTQRAEDRPREAEPAESAEEDTVEWTEPATHRSTRTWRGPSTQQYRRRTSRGKEVEQMAETQYKQLTREELEKLAGEELPERAAMSLINANVAAPINAALALNVASDGSIAYANAEQSADITQSN